MILKRMYYQFLRWLIIQLNAAEDRLQLEQKENWRKSLHNKPVDFRIGKDSMMIGAEYMTIGEGFGTGLHFRIEAIDSYLGERFTPRIEIGRNVYFGDYCHIGCVSKLKIGEGTMGGSKIYITDHYHGAISSAEIETPPAKRYLSSKDVEIGKNNWIGDGVAIMPGVVLGDNVIVGANSVVTHSFPSNSVIAGCPARLIKTLNT